MASTVLVVSGSHADFVEIGVDQLQNRGATAEAATRDAHCDQYSGSDNASDNQYSNAHLFVA